MVFLIFFGFFSGSFISEGFKVSEDFRSVFEAISLNGLVIEGDFCCEFLEFGILFVFEAVPRNGKNF